MAPWLSLRLFWTILVVLAMFCVGAVAQDVANEGTSSLASSSFTTSTSPTASAPTSDTTVYTTYTDNGSIVTWYATTPSTTLATVSTGSVEALTDYFSTMSPSDSSSSSTSSASSSLQVTGKSARWLTAVAGVVGAAVLGGGTVL